MSTDSRIITARSEMLDELRRIRPTHAAVAYVGKDWRELLGVQQGKKIGLKEIVLAPIAGTDPKAVEQIIGELGIDNVHFLEQLHAKVYIGSKRVMLGSANLSSSALGAGGRDLYEMVFATSEDAHRSDAIRAFERYRNLARCEYPTPKSKTDRLTVLKRVAPKLRAAAEVEGNVRQQAPTIDGYEIGSKRIHLEWWSEGADDGGEAADRDYMNMLARKGVDRPREGDWVLTWHCKADGKPRKNPGLAWIRVDEVRLDRRDDPDYTDQVAETHRPLAGSEPFKLDARFARLFRELIVQRPKLHAADGVDGPALLSPRLADINALLQDIQAQYVSGA